jgi:hypothetical protein
MKKILKKYLPNSIINILVKLRYRYYIWKGFNHRTAQKGEFRSSIRFMTSGNKFMELVYNIEALKNRNLYEEIIYPIPHISNFFRNIEEYNAFSDDIQNKRCLEIGSGPIGFLGLMPWIKERIIIDPLLDKYKNFQLSHFGKTFFTDDIQRYSQDAETPIPSLENSINGCIVVRNALDHCANPWEILKNISQYASVGCKLLLWTDLWHLRDIGSEHRNITKDKYIFEKKLTDLGFKIENTFSDVRNGNSTIEYGYIAIKTKEIDV